MLLQCISIAVQAMRKQISKKIFSKEAYKATSVFFVLVVLFLVFVPTVFALDTGLEYGELTGLGTQDIRISIMKIIRVVLGFVGIIALGFIIYAGFVWMTSGGNPEKIDIAKRTLRNAVIGLIIILSAFAIVSFIIQALVGSIGSGGCVGDDCGPPPPCVNCGHLGSGIIERVYPAPDARNVPRNTNISVTFKVPMNPETIIENISCDAANVCTGDLKTDSIKIYPTDEGSDAALESDAVVATTSDNKHFEFNVRDYLGDGLRNKWYSVHLTSDIEKDNGERAFKDSGFIWTFEIGTVLDLDPVELSTVFPPPDDLGDDYSVSAPVSATGSITVNGQPRVEQQAAVSEPSALPGAPNARIDGEYNCDVNSDIEATVQGGSLTIVQSPVVPGMNTSATIQNETAVLGCGILLVFDGSVQNGNRWSFTVTAEHDADTLRVDNYVFRFVSSDPSDDEIVSAVSAQTTAQNIVSAITSENLSVTAVRSGSTVQLTSRIPGQRGNATPVTASGSWASISPLQGGDDAVLTPSVQDAPDQPRNVIITLDFNEVVSEVYLNSSLIVEYNTAVDGSGNWEQVGGAWIASNQGKTVDFVSLYPCLDEQNNYIQNACNEVMYCLPVLDVSPYQATLYRVRMNSGVLKNCVPDTNDCSDSNFSFCVDTPGDSESYVCNQNNEGTGAWYPEAQAGSPNGLIDMANNTFNGNGNVYTLSEKILGRAEGPLIQSGWSAYNLNLQSSETGDDSMYYFYINKSIKHTAPKITAIVPAVGGNSTSLVEPIASTYDSVMMSSSLKPGNNYNDGMCSCVQDSDCDVEGGERCDTDRGRCVNTDISAQQYCSEDSSCSEDNFCINKKYVSLVDTSSRPVGWWIEKNNLPFDDYPQQTRSELIHTRFYEITRYGSEIGSGVKDIYQNCFLPSKGPVSNECNPLTDENCCPVTKAQPYCCDGQALNKSGWEASSCFTGY